MSIELDHAIVTARDKVAAAQLLAKLLGVPCGPAKLGPFWEVYVNGGLTLDFIQSDEPFPVEHFCFRVTQDDFDAILARLREAGIAYRSNVRGPADMKVGEEYGNVYWNEPEGHQWEMLTTSYTRAPHPA
jgi:hypothetical protein